MKYAIKAIWLTCFFVLTLAGCKDKFEQDEEDLAAELADQKNLIFTTQIKLKYADLAPVEMNSLNVFVVPKIDKIGNYRIKRYQLAQYESKKETKEVFNLAKDEYYRVNRYQKDEQICFDTAIYSQNNYDFHCLVKQDEKWRVQENTSADNIKFSFTQLQSYDLVGLRSLISGRFKALQDYKAFKAVLSGPLTRSDYLLIKGDLIGLAVDKAISENCFLNSDICTDQKEEIALKKYV